MVQKYNLGKQTLAAKTYTDHKKWRRPLSIPLEQAINYQAESTQALGEDFRSGAEFVYQRFGHPTGRAAGEKIAALEKAEAGIVFSSGMGAISTTLLALSCPTPSHVISQRDIFAQTFTFLNETLLVPSHGFRLAFRDEVDQSYLLFESLDLDQPRPALWLDLSGPPSLRSARFALKASYPFADSH